MPVDTVGYTISSEFVFFYWLRLDSRAKREEDPGENVNPGLQDERVEE